MFQGNREKYRNSKQMGNRKMHFQRNKMSKIEIKRLKEKSFEIV